MEEQSADTKLIANRLHRDLISKDFLASTDIYQSWVEYPYISDYAPILLQLDLPTTHLFYTFKMNPFWTHDLSFYNLVR